jgi:hypothetical protein
VVIHTYNPNSQVAEEEDHEFKATLGYRVIKKKTKTPHY